MKDWSVYPMSNYVECRFVYVKSQEELERIFYDVVRRDSMTGVFTVLVCNGEKIPLGYKTRVNEIIEAAEKVFEGAALPKKDSDDPLSWEKWQLSLYHEKEDKRSVLQEALKQAKEKQILIKVTGTGCSLDVGSSTTKEELESWLDVYSEVVAQKRSEEKEIREKTNEYRKSLLSSGEKMKYKLNWLVIILNRYKILYVEDDNHGEGGLWGSWRIYHPSYKTLQGEHYCDSLTAIAYSFAIALQLARHNGEEINDISYEEFVKIDSVYDSYNYDYLAHFNGMVALLKEHWKYGEELNLLSEQ